MMSMTTESGARGLGILCLLLAFGVIWAGCGTANVHGAADSSPDAVQPAAGASAETRLAGPGAGGGTISDRLSVGDLVHIEILDIPEKWLPLDITVREDGTITVPLLNAVPAAGKTTGELADAIKQAYVPAYFKHMTVIVRAGGQFFSVRGEVKLPGRFPFVGAMSVLKAIASAGDFTEYARKRTVRITRAKDGRIEKVDCIKALRNPKLDLPVYPGDLISVERRNPFQR
jgi:polysaccharide export outer membrane protein